LVKEQFTIRLPKGCAEWLGKKVKSRVYATSSHAIEVLILNEMRKEGIIKDE